MKHFRLISSFISLLIVLVEILLGIRFILKALGANELSEFAQWIYTISQSFLAPFANIFPSPTVGSGYVVELSTILAMVVYAILGYIAEEVVNHLEDAFTKKGLSKNPEIPKI